MWRKLFNGLTACLFIVGAAQAQESEREIAREFAPDFTQGLGETPRFDYFARFDFDGDWRGDNNWNNAASVPDSAFDAYVYYVVSETATHYFVHYAVFHPRDYKGGESGTLLSDLLRQGAGVVGKRDPTGLLDEARLTHENDLEGCLVVAEKRDNDLSRAVVVYVETISHNHFKRYAVESSSAAGIMLNGNHPQLYVEPKGHGIEALTAAREEREKRTLFYAVSERADNPFENRNATVGYELLPIYTTLWTHAAKAPNATYGISANYGTQTLMTARGAQKVKLGNLGAAFLGKIGAPNSARPPWGWYDIDERAAPPGQWFFDPAQTIRRHFNLGENFSVAYTRHPLMKIGG